MSNLTPAELDELYRYTPQPGDKVGSVTQMFDDGAPVADLPLTVHVTDGFPLPIWWRIHHENGVILVDWRGSITGEEGQLYIDGRTGPGVIGMWRFALRDDVTHTVRFRWHAEPDPTLRTTDIEL